MDFRSVAQLRRASWVFCEEVSKRKPSPILGGRLYLVPYILPTENEIRLKS